MRKILLCLLITVFTFCTAQAQEDAFTKDIKKYLDATGSKQTFKAVMEQMMGQFNKMYPNVPAETWDELKKEFNETSIDDLYNLIIPVYKKLFTHEDIKKFLEFYDSPAGRKLAEKTPLIAQESMMAGQKWGAELASKVSKRIEEKNKK